MRTSYKLGLLSALYLVQGLPYGFFTQALPVLLRDAGLSLEHIGLTSLLALPWALKALWAPLVDRIGTRRRWILSLQAVAALLLLALALQRPASSGLSLLLAAVLLTNLVAATQDIATDGLAVSFLHHRERGLGVLVALSSLPLLGSPAVGRERLPVPASPNPWSWLRQPGVLAWIAVLVAFKLGDYLVQGMLRPWMVDQGLSMGDIGLLLGTAGFTAGLVGAVVGGALVGSLGRRLSLVLFGLLQTAGLAGYALCAWQGRIGAPLWAAVVAEHLLGGMATAALFTAMMDRCRQGHEGTDYTLQASVVVLASGLGAGVSGFGAEALGYAGLFALGAGLSVLGPVLAARAATSS